MKTELVNSVKNVFREDYGTVFKQIGNSARMKQLHEDTISMSQVPPPPTPYGQMRQQTRSHASLAMICAFLGLFVLPEIFASAGIILGAYTWRREQGNRGLSIVILGIACMLVGLYITAVFIIGDLFLA